MGRTVSHGSIAIQRPVGCQKVLGGGGTDKIGSTLPSHIQRHTEVVPFPFFDQVKNPMKTIRHLHRPIFKSHPLFITFGENRQQFLDGQCPGFGNDHVACFLVEFLVDLIFNNFLAIHLLPDNELLVSSVG